MKTVTRFHCNDDTVMDNNTNTAECAYHLQSVMLNNLKKQIIPVPTPHPTHLYQPPPHDNDDNVVTK